MFSASKLLHVRSFKFMFSYRNLSIFTLIFWMGHDSTDNNNWWYYFTVLSLLVTLQSDHNKRLMVLTVITLSVFHWTCLSSSERLNRWIMFWVHFLVVTEKEIPSKIAFKRIVRIDISSELRHNIIWHLDYVNNPIVMCIQNMKL